MLENMLLWVQEIGLLKLVVNGSTIVAWGIGIYISVIAGKKMLQGQNMVQDLGISPKVYFSLVAITEIVYTIGAFMILSAMGYNIFGSLVDFDFHKVWITIKDFDITTAKIIGWTGWIGFVLNRGISFISPLYLLIGGGEKLRQNGHYFYISAQIEIVLEIITTMLVAWALFLR